MNHYDVLEVSPKASAEVIRAAYKSLMQRHHPDKRPDTSAADEHASRIAQAYEVLGNPDKRLAYDQEIRLHPLTGGGTPGTEPRAAVRAAARPSPRRPKSALRSWYPWLLIVCITGAGAMIHGLSKGKSAPGPELPPTQPSERAQTASTLPAGTNERVAARVQAQIIPAFVTQLTIGLTSSGVTTNGAGHVLLIPEVGLRVGTSDPARWAQKIEAKRELLIRQLLDRLGEASYEELVKADGDLYLKRLIESAVAEGVGYDRSAPLPASPDAGPALPPLLEALLPLSFTVR